jgi:ABC-type transport system involved in multi-copper enzyme maturation permease subunit
MNWNLWLRQVRAIVRMELLRYLKARRWFGVYLVAFGPLFLILMAGLRGAMPDANIYANLFQAFVMRFGIFISALAIFSQSFRGDVLDKTLHFYLLAPARREVLAIGKYAAAAVFTSAVFGLSTSASYLLMHVFMEEPRPPLFSHMVQYVIVAVLACMIYGAVCYLVGMLFKNPSPPAVILLAWEGLSFLLPPLFQQFSAVHYLQSLLPVTVDRGPFAVIVEPTSAFVGVPVLLIVTAVLLAAAAWMFRFTQVTYSAD